MGWRIVKWKNLVKRRPDRPEQFKHGSPRMLIPTDTSPEYVQLMMGRGSDHLSGWVAIAAYYACQNEDKRKDGKLWCGGQPATAENIAMVRFLSVKTIERAIDKLLEIGWLRIWSTSGEPVVAIGLPVVSPNVKESNVMESKVKEEKKPSTQKLSFGEAGLVKLTEGEYNKLCEDFGQESIDTKIQTLEDYVGSKGKKYKSHYHTIRTWICGDHKKQDEARRTAARAIVDKIIKDNNINPRVGDAVVHISQNYPRWPINDGNLAQWCFDMRHLNEVQLQATTKAIIIGPEDKEQKSIEPSTRILARKVHLYASGPTSKGTQDDGN